ncbi:MAG: phosphomannomutase [Oceanococcaceae bacterium]
MPLSCFKAYDIRGRLPDELNVDVAYRIGRAYARAVKPQRVVTGRDVRLSSASLQQALAQGLHDEGVEVLDIGLCGTEEVYFATFHYKLDGGIMVTASHNPMDYNGMKLVREGARPIGSNSGLAEIETAVEQDTRVCPDTLDVAMTALDHRADYITHLLGHIDTEALTPLNILVNAGNGPAGIIVDGLAEHLPFRFTRLHHEPDGTFPNGIPNPILEENRPVTAQAVLAASADFGVAWDGDFDRCFLFDEQGQFIDGYYIVGLLADALLQINPGSTIVHDNRMTWNTEDIVRSQGGETVVSRTGHAFIKKIMRENDALYGGEMSAHHYFRNFAYCDNGNIPWLLVAALLCKTGKPLSALVSERIAKYPSSGEINRKVDDAPAAIERVYQHFAGTFLHEDRLDGLTLEFPQWRFNLRMSNTEPVTRLNVETRGDIKLMREKTAEIVALL